LKHRSCQFCLLYWFFWWR